MIEIWFSLKLKLDKLTQVSYCLRLRSFEMIWCQNELQRHQISLVGHIHANGNIEVIFLSFFWDIFECHQSQTYRRRLVQPFIAPCDPRGHLLTWKCSRPSPHIIIQASYLAWWFLYTSRRERHVPLDFNFIWRRMMLQGEFDPRRRSLRLEQGGKFSHPWVWLIVRISSL